LDLPGLLDQLLNDPELTFRREANALGVGNIAYFKVQGEGFVLKVNENNVILRVEDHELEIETEFIFGNAVRDASGLVRINDFDRTSDINLISETINHKIRSEIIPPFRARVKEGNKVKFTGAMELNMSHLELDRPEVIPVSIQITP